MQFKQLNHSELSEGANFSNSKRELQKKIRDEQTSVLKKPK